MVLRLTCWSLGPRSSSLFSAATTAAPSIDGPFERAGGGLFNGGLAAIDNNQEEMRNSEGFYLLPKRKKKDSSF